MKHSPYSYSRLRTYNECPRKFKFKYIDELPPAPTDSVLPMVEGQLFHKFGEIYDNSRLAGSPLPFQEAFTQALKAVSTTLPNASVEDVSALCADYHKNPQPTEHLIGAEYAWAVNEAWEQCEYDSPEAVLRGIWDLLYINGGWGKIVDHKTSRLANSEPLQRECYISGAFATFPQLSSLDFVFLYHRIKWKDESSYTTMEEVMDARKMVAHHINKIEEDTTFAPNPSPQCHRECPYAQYCLKDIKKYTSEPALSREPENLEEAMEMAIHILQAEKSIAQAKRFLKKFVEVHGDVSVMGRTFRISSSQTWKKLGVLELLNALKNYDIPEWWKFVSPNWKAVRQAVEENPNLEKRLDSLGERTLKQSFGSVKAEAQNTGEEDTELS